MIYPFAAAIMGATAEEFVDVAFFSLKYSSLASMFCIFLTVSHEKGALAFGYTSMVSINSKASGLG